MSTTAAGRARLAAAILSILGGLCCLAQAQQGSTYKVVAFSGQSAPGGDTYYTFGNPTIGADGSVGFVGTNWRGEGYDWKVFAGKPGSLRLVAATGDKVPGEDNATFQDFQSVSVSKEGRVAFNAGVSDDGYVQGIWAEISGDLAPGDEDGIDPLSLSQLGSVAFRSGSIILKGQTEWNESVSDAIFVGVPGSVKEVLRTGQQIAGKLLQRLYDNSGELTSAGTAVDANESGAVAFKAIASPSASPAPKETIYVGDVTAPTPLATAGEPAPGLDGYQYAHLSTQPSIASNGLAAFSATISDGESSSSAIFASLPEGGLSSIAVQGTTVPTTSDVTFGELSDAVVNATGDVIFRATIRYPNQTTRSGIWLQRRTGPAVLVAVSGIELPTPSGMREVSSVDFAGPGSFNDLHEFVFRATFDNEDEGIYVADTRPGAPIIAITRPSKPRERVTTKSSILVTGIATDDTGVAKVEYTVTHEVSAAKRTGQKRGKRFITSRVKLAQGGSNWLFKVPLSMGLNLISITATDKLGNTSEAYSIRVLRYRGNAKGASR